MPRNKGPSPEKPNRVTKNRTVPKKKLTNDPAPPSAPVGPSGAPGEAIGGAPGKHVDSKVRALREAISLARAFANLGDSLLATATPKNRERVNFGSRLSGAVRRRSMDLTQALAKFRKGGNFG